MVKFRQKGGTHLKFHGPNQSRSGRPDEPAEADTPLTVNRKKKKPAQCGEVEDCPLRTKCKAGVCKT